MATRNRPVGFGGGISRWVTGEEVRQFAQELSALDTLAALRDWGETTPSAPVYIRFAGLLAAESDEVALSDDDTKKALRDTVVDLGRERRQRAISDYARERRLHGPAGRSLARCPACDVPLDLGCSAGFYCRDHTREQEAEVWELLGHEPPGDTNWRPLGL